MAVLNCGRIIGSMLSHFIGFKTLGNDGVDGLERPGTDHDNT